MPSPNSTLLTYSVATLPSPIQVATPLSLTVTADNQTGAAITCTQIVVTLPVGSNASDLIATAQIEAVPPTGWTAAQNGGQIIFTPPGGSVQVKGKALVFLLALSVNDQPGAANVLIDETASNRTNPAGVRSTTWVATKFPVDFTLGPLTAVPIGNTDIPYGSPAQLNWTATGTGVTCTLSYVPDDSGTQVSAAVPATAPSGGFTTQPLTRAAGVTFYLTAQVSVPGQDEPITLQSQLPVSVETLSLNVTVQPLTIPPGGISMISWSAPNATRCITKDGEVLPPSGTAYVVLHQTHDFTITAYGANGQTQQAPTIVTVDPTIVATEAGYTITGATGTGPAGLPVTITNNADNIGTISFDGAAIPFQVTQNSFTVTIDGVTRPPTPGDLAAFLAVVCPTPGQAPAGILAMALPPLDLTGTSERVIPISVTGGTGDTGGPGGTFTLNFPRPPGTLSFQGPGCPGGQGGNARAIITADPTQTPAQYIFTFAVGPGGTGGSGQLGTGAPGLPGVTTALAFGGLVVPLDGSLVTPVPFMPLALTVTAIPPTVPMNGLALVRWQSPNADHCVLWDGSVVPAKGKRYIVMTATTDFQVSAVDDFGQTIHAGATVTVDSAIKPTETGNTQTGTPGTTGYAGTSPTWTFNITPPITMPSGWTAGGPGGTGGDAALGLNIPPLDTTGTSTRVIPITVTGGAGGAGGAGGCLVVLDAPAPFPSPQPAPVMAVASPGGTGGNGGGATLVLTTDPTQAPARIILNVAAGTAGAGGQNGWLFDNNGASLGPTYATAGTPGGVSVTVDDVPITLQG